MPLWDGSQVKNGSAFSKASVRYIFANQTVEFCGEYSFSHKQESAFGYGTNPAFGPMKQTVGKYVPGGLKVKGFTGGVQKMRELVAEQSANGRSYGAVWFPIHMQLLDANESPIDLEFVSCKWEEETSQISDNADPLQDELSFTFFRMLRNGLTLWDSSAELL